METKYKILLGLYSAFMAFFMLIVPWRGKGGSYGDATAMIFFPPYPGSSIDVEEVIWRLVMVNVFFGIAYVLVKKLSPKASKFLR